jgi:hypothetical protein
MSSTDVAVTCGAGMTGLVVGAVYVLATPLAVLVGLKVPQAGEHTAPYCKRLQVTPRFAPSFVTMAENCCVAPGATLAVAGDIETEIGKTCMEAVPFALVFVIDVATSNVATTLVGGVGGAV